MIIIDSFLECSHQYFEDMMTKALINVANEQIASIFILS
jgi:hypothetical protein